MTRRSPPTPARASTPRTAASTPAGPPQLAEFDVIRGLTGYGAYLLRRDPPAPPCARSSDYWYASPNRSTPASEVLPGWWTANGPSGRPDERFPGGHANSGLAHGIGGSLALLALAARRGITVHGQLEPSDTDPGLAGPLAETTDRGPAWPYWVTPRRDLRGGRLAPSAPRRPSWCYGTAGLARAQQLAALALGDTARRAEAEHALVSRPRPTPHSSRPRPTIGLCHGFAGLAHVAARTATTRTPRPPVQLRATIQALLAAVCPPGTDPATAAAALVRDEDAGPGFLDGAAGIALAVLAPATRTPSPTAWDSCLLVA